GIAVPNPTPPTVAVYGVLQVRFSNANTTTDEYRFGCAALIPQVPASSLTIVATPPPGTTLAPTGDDSFTVNVSFASNEVSALTVTATKRPIARAGIVTVPAPPV